MTTNILLVFSTREAHKRFPNQNHQWLADKVAYWMEKPNIGTGKTLKIIGETISNESKKANGWED